MNDTASPGPARPALKNKQQAAKYLGGISVRTLERLIKDGQIKTVKLRGRVMLRTDDLDATAGGLASN